MAFSVKQAIKIDDVRHFVKSNHGDKLNTLLNHDSLDFPSLLEFKEIVEQAYKHYSLAYANIPPLYLEKLIEIIVLQGRAHNMIDSLYRD